MKSKSLVIKNNSTINVELLKDKSSIREAKELDDLVFIEHQGITLNEIAAIAEQAGLLGIRNSDGKLIAEAQIIFQSIPYICDLEPETALCYGSAVHPSYRRLGLGRVLMKAKEALAIEQGINKLTLTVRPENAPAILLWQKCGFSLHGYDPHYFGEGPDSGRLLMEKILDENSTHKNEPSGNASTLNIKIRTGAKPDIWARETLNRMTIKNQAPIGYEIISNELALIKIQNEGISGK